MADRRRSFVRRGPQRGTSWEGAQLDTLLTTAVPTTFQVVTTEAVLEGFPNPTLVRQRGEMLILEKQQAANDRGIVTCGLYFANAVALAAGALQAPLTDIGSDWIWWSTRGMGRDVGVVPETALGSITRMEIDGKAMRKAQPNQALVMVCQLVTLAGANVQYQVTGAIRLLYKK